MSKPRSIAVLLFEGVNAVDVAGPLEAFAAVHGAGGARLYQTQTWTLGNRQVRSESGLGLHADRLAPDRPSADLLIVPGGPGVREPETLVRLAGWLRRHHASFGRVAAVCTGAYALAEAGLVNGVRVATHWAHARDLQERYPAVRVDADAIFLSDGRFYSSGGVTAGIDLALDIIETDFGVRAAMDAARELVVFLRRTGTQAQFSEPLKMQVAAAGPLRDVCNWAAANLDADLSIEALASHAGLSERQFSRRFRETFSVPPAGFIKTLRLDTARTLLGQGTAPNQVAAATGFGSLDAFRRAFVRQFGVAPNEYQRKFASSKEQR